MVNPCSMPLSFSTLHLILALMPLAGPPAPAARTVARRRAARPGLWLSFVTHLRYNEPDRLFPFPHRLLHAASA